MLPDDPESTILKRLKKPKPDDAGTGEQHTDIADPAVLARSSGRQ
jgi:hypothetical protein